MKYLVTESQLKRLIERKSNSPAYKGPKGYDDSCDCYVDEEIKEKKDYFTASKFGDEEGNEFSVEKVYDFVKKNKDKYYKESYPIEKIKHNLEWWNKNYDIKNPKHKKRMMNADTSYPLLVVVEKNGNYSVADGLNRLYKAIKIEKKKTLPVYVVKKNDIEHLSQEKKIDESISTDGLRSWFNFISKKDLKKHPGADSFKRYLNIKAFQKWIDLIFEYTKRKVNLDGVKGMNVATVWVEPWGKSFSRPELPASRLDYIVRMSPDFDEQNPPSSQQQFESQYEDFQKRFESIADSIGIDHIQPVQDKKVKDVKIRFNFLDSKVPTVKSEMREEELTEKCWPGYTQKGMKTMFGKRYPNCVKKTKK